MSETAEAGNAAAEMVSAMANLINRFYVLTRQDGTGILPEYAELRCQTPQKAV